MFRSQVANIDETVAILEKDNEWLLKAGQTVESGQGLPAGDGEKFSKKEYQALKEQIKQRKVTKQRILAQGFPELKAYTRL